MGVKTEIAQDLFRPGKGSLAVDHPVHFVEPVEQRGEDGDRAPADDGRKTVATDWEAILDCAEIRDPFPGPKALAML